MAFFISVIKIFSFLVFCFDSFLVFLSLCLHYPSALNTLSIFSIRDFSIFIVFLSNSWCDNPIVSVISEYTSDIYSVAHDFSFVCLCVCFSGSSFLTARKYHFPSVAFPAIPRLLQ